MCWKYILQIYHLSIDFGIFCHAYLYWCSQQIWGPPVRSPEEIYLLLGFSKLSSGVDSAHLLSFSSDGHIWQTNDDLSQDLTLVQIFTPVLICTGPGHSSCPKHGKSCKSPHRTHPLGSGCLLIQTAIWLMNRKDWSWIWEWQGTRMFLPACFHNSFLSLEFISN